MMAEACEDYDEDCCAWSRREAARLKQIQIGKARPEYQRYVREVMPSKRTPSQPSTPDPRARVSKRQFDRALGEWRRRLHEFDTVPRNPPRCGSFSVEVEDDMESEKAVTGGLSKSGPESFATAISRSGNRRTRGTVAPRGERSTGKFGPRKPAETFDEEPHCAEEVVAIPPPPPPSQTTQPASTAQQSGVVRISLADQLMEMPSSTMVAASPPACVSWPWYDMEAAWACMETPQRPHEIQFMPLETPPEKPLMPSMGLLHQTYDENFLKVMDMYSQQGQLAESSMIPQRLFDSSPQKSEHEQFVQANIMHTETTGESGEGVSLSNPPVEVDPPASPRTTSQPYELASLLSPSLRCLASPV